MPSYWVRQVRHTNIRIPHALTERKTKGTKKQLKYIYIYICEIQHKLKGVVHPRRCGRQNRTVRENRVRPRPKEKDRKTEAQQNIFGEDAAVCGRRSIVGRGSTYYVVGLVSCYPVYHLLPEMSAAFSLGPLPSPLPIALDATHNGCERTIRKNGLMSNDRGM